MGEHDHDHDHHAHDHDHEPPSELVEEGAPVDLARFGRWRVSVILGAAVAAVGWLAWPATHLILTPERPLTHVLAAPATLGMACTLGFATWLLTATPDPRPAGPHRVGQHVLRGLATLAAALAALAWGLGRKSGFAIAIDIVSFPTVLLLLLLGFAYVGRLSRIAGARRGANLADLAGLVLPLLWAGAQMLGSGSDALLQASGSAGLLLGTTVFVALFVAMLRLRPWPTTGSA